MEYVGIIKFVAWRQNLVSRLVRVHTGSFPPGPNEFDRWMNLIFPSDPLFRIVNF